MTVKHVLTGRKHDKLGNQTFEVLQPLKRTVHTIPLTYFTYWSSSRHLNYFISEILGQRNTWFEVSAVFVYRKHRKLSNFGAKVCLTAVELQMFGYQACHVCAQLEHVFFCHVSTLRRKRRYLCPFLLPSGISRVFDPLARALRRKPYTTTVIKRDHNDDDDPTPCHSSRIWQCPL